MSFWDGMELWEKMLFVLACAIVCTLVYAAAKLAYGNRRVKRHTMLAEARKSHLENVRSSRHVIALKGEDIPFGIKALECGIEVEGIVISRSATPDSRRSQQTLVGSDTDSNMGSRGPSALAANQQMMQTGRPLVYQPSPYIALPSQAHISGSASSSMRSSAASLASNPNGAGPSDASYRNGRRSKSDTILPVPSPAAQASHSGASTPSSIFEQQSPDPITLARLEGRLTGLHHSRHRRTKRYPSHSPPKRIQSRTPTPPEGQRTPTLPSVHEDSTGESSRESDSSIEGDEIDRPRRPGLIAAYSTPALGRRPMGYRYVPETAYGDLSLLHIHRLSHAAEVGQLMPRHSRTSRVLSGAGFTATPSPSYLGMRGESDPVYTFDLAVPPPAATISIVKPEEPPLPPLPLNQPTPIFPQENMSQFVEDLWRQSSLDTDPDVGEITPVEILRPENVDNKAEDPVPISPTTERKGPNKLRKKRQSRARNSMPDDLEAQN